MSGSVSRSFRRSLWVVAALAVGWLGSTPPAHAEITAIVVDRTDDVTIGGQPYRFIRGRAFGALDPSHPRNAIINRATSSIPDR